VWDTAGTARAGWHGEREKEDTAKQESKTEPWVPATVLRCIKFKIDREGAWWKREKGKETQHPPRAGTELWFDHSHPLGTKNSRGPN